MVLINSGMIFSNLVSRMNLYHCIWQPWLNDKQIQRVSRIYADDLLLITFESSIIYEAARAAAKMGTSVWNETTIIKFNQIKLAEIPDTLCGICHKLYFKTKLCSTSTSVWKVTSRLGFHFILYVDTFWKYVRSK